MRRALFFLVWLIIALTLVLAAFRLAALWREVDDRVLHMPDEGSTVQTALGEVYIEQAGPEDGMPILLVHGSVGWSRFWFETTDALAAAGYRAISFDLSPMGYSERDPQGDYSRTAQATRITALTDALGIKPVLVAHSFGAGPGAEAVLRDQNKFAGLVVVDGAIGIGTQDDPGGSRFRHHHQPTFAEAAGANVPGKERSRHRALYGPAQTPVPPEWNH